MRAAFSGKVASEFFGESHGFSSIANGGEFASYMFARQEANQTAVATKTMMAKTRIVTPAESQFEKESLRYLILSR
jgi:hypothetical protein